MKKYFVARVEEDANGQEVFVRLTTDTEDLQLAETWCNAAIEASYWNEIVILSLEMGQ